MARRPDTSDDSNSSQIVDERPVDVKRERRSRRAAVEDEDEDERDEIEMTLADGPGEEDDEDNGPSQRTNGENSEEDDEEQEEDDEAGGSARSAKRQRTSTEGTYANSDAGASARRQNAPLERDKDGFVKGSIVRVKLHNFLTYDDVEFRPGPYLNMVLGPNGTGKSSIACALCLGLNYEPKLLGRATKLQEFVKMGKEKGSIEIELKGPPGKANLIIVRELDNSMDRAKHFFLNGTKTPGAKVTEEVENLGIQMSNLCSFLPQDKVADFARMSNTDLLKATEEAAGDKDLRRWHEQLIKYGKELSEAAKDCATEDNEIKTLEQRNRNSERDVETYRKRKRLEDQIKLLDLLLPFKEYLDAREEYTALKSRRQKLHDKCKELEARDQPAKELQKRLEKEHEELEKHRDEIRKRAKGKIDLLKTTWRKAEKLREDSEKVEEKLSSLRKQITTRRKKIESLTREIRAIEEWIANPPQAESISDIRQEETSNGEALTAKERERYKLTEAIKQPVEASAGAKRSMEQAESHLQRLDNVEARRLDALRKTDSQTATVIDWLRKNQSKFRQPVIEPAAISVSVKNVSMANAVEAGFSAAQLKTFVFQCEEDYKLFNRLICDTGEGLGHRCRVATWFRPSNPNAVAPPPFTQEELKALGFEAYAIDLINSPPGMAFYLRVEVRLHRLAISLKDNVDINRAMDIATRERPYSGNFIAGNTQNIVGRSQYGARKPFNQTRNVLPAKNFGNHSVDEGEKSRLQKQYDESKYNFGEAEKEVDERSREISKIEDEIRAIDKTRDKIKARMHAAHQIAAKIQKAHFKLDEKQKALKDEENAPSVEEQRTELQRKTFDLAKRRFDLAKELKTISRGAIDETHEGSAASLKQLQAAANVAALKNMLETRSDGQRAAMQEFNQVVVEFNEMKTTTKTKLHRSREKLEQADPEVREQFQEMEADDKLARLDTENIRVQLTQARTDLDLMVGVNSGIIEAYENRLREIERKKEKLERMLEKKKLKEDRVQKIRGKWEPALQELIDAIGVKFSAGFERVGCAGEIQLGRHEDFEQWCIKILVKFRDTEELRELTGTRQSGGERALSTIMYLMSLVENARPPFSLVDEINQGMDQNYERAVHNSLVDVTCATGTPHDAQVTSGQYFLITPKLLTDLKYHERMKVLCVCNGEWLPEPEERVGGSLKNMVVRARQRRELRAAQMAAAAA